MSDTTSPEGNMGYIHQLLEHYGIEASEENIEKLRRSEHRLIKPAVDSVLEGSADPPVEKLLGALIVVIIERFG